MKENFRSQSSPSFSSSPRLFPQLVNSSLGKLSVKTFTHIPSNILEKRLLETREPSKESVRHVATQIHRSFSQIGFAYLINHGFPKEQVLAVQQKSLEFFKLPINVKEKYKRSLPYGLGGYLSFNKEILQPGVQQEMKETFEMIKADSVFPAADEVPGFKQSCVNFLDSCRTLSRRFLKVLAVALGGIKNRKMGLSHSAK
ncbi:probable 2-oxoglutarate-dependent dioxygenase At3g50210 [Limulus polyphemus]|uniref:Probable 2-oxoglutarate-dependent dioxygenase At3g50210 n=1 Tax=Limulus polyphemus TaxID=6850 RepID=A0ABM1SCU9_LIMPO|nr:probable 2-oxoglutarate-dependent dioxygenase At3g50210 [Limulus polyphemus]